MKIYYFSFYYKLSEKILRVNNLLINELNHNLGYYHYDYYLHHQ